MVLGIGFSIYGIALFFFDMRRMSAFDRRLGVDSGGSTEDRLLVALTGAGALLGVGALAVIVAQ